MGRLEEAEAEARRGADDARGLGDGMVKEYGYLVCERLQVTLARIMSVRGDPSRAVELLRDPLQTFSRLRVPIPEVEGWVALGEAFWRVGDAAASESALSRALAGARGMGLVLLEAEALLLIALVRRDPSAARAAVDAAERAGAPLRTLRAVRLLAEMAEASGDPFATAYRSRFEASLRALATGLPRRERTLAIDSWRRP